MFKIIRRKKLWFTLSVLLTVISIVALIFFRLNVGIDFKGGTLWELKVTEGKFDKVKVESIFKDQGFKNVSVQLSGDQDVIARLENLDKDQHAKLLTAFEKTFKGVKENRYETVGPTVSSDLTRKAIMAIAIASLGIIFYLAFAFRKVVKPANPWKFGVCAVIALIHDALFVLGMFAIFGHFFEMEINSLFVTAILTVIGFSVHDTIVVFDRIRENLHKMNKPFEEIVEYSINQTLVRSLATSFTALLVLSSILILGGETIRPFVLALAIGILVGTYSSIFLASPLLVVWQKKQIEQK